MNLLSAAIVFWSTMGFAQLSVTSLPILPAKTWRVQQTEHFEIIYAEENKTLAQEYAREAERAHKLLQPLLDITVPARIPLVLADITDDSNGSATGIPRSEIEVFPVLPSVEDSTSEYYGWSRELVTHEYTHILNFEPTSGVMRVLRTIFGAIIKPGGFLPRWYTEGLAVEMESRLTPVGRGRSTYYSALVRSQVEDKTWGTETIDRINSTEIPTWPRGQRPYTFGYFLMHDLGERPHDNIGDKNIYKILNDQYGGRFPWFINGPVEDHFGRDYPELLAETYYKLGDLAKNQLETLTKSEAAGGKPLNQPGYNSFGAQISPDGLKLAAITVDYDEDPTIQLWSRSSTSQSFKSAGPPKAIASSKGIHQLAWRANSREIIYDHSDTYQHFSRFGDLYELDIVSEHEEQLTYGARAREATVLPDGSLLFVTVGPGITKLVHSDPKGRNIQTLISPASGDRISSPRAYLDGAVYSHRDSQGHEWIEYFSLKTGKTEKLTQPTEVGKMHVMPAPAAASNEAVYFAANDSGVMNVYRFEKHRTTSVSNVTTYATSPVVDSATGELIFSRLNGQGFRLESIKLPTESPTVAKVESLEKYPKADETHAGEVKTEDDYSYNGVRYLFPQYLIPWVYFVPGGALFSLSTSADDPLEHHQLSLNAAFDTRVQKVGEEFAYTNGSLPFQINALFANDYLYLVGAGLPEHITMASLETAHFLTRDRNKWMAGPEVTYRMTDYPGYLFTEFGPGAFVAYNNVTPPKDFQISSESGDLIQLTYMYFLPQWGNTAYPAVLGHAEEFLSGKPLPKHHVVSVKGTAWISPPQSTILTGTQQAGGEYPGSLFQNLFLVRGYPVGEFIGSTMYIGNLEYRFPIYSVFRGSGTFPFFSNKWHGAFVTDAITLQGGYYDGTSSPAVLTVANLGRMFVSSGIEALLDAQIFYAVPITLKLGVYYGFTNQALGGWTGYIGFSTVQ